MKPTEQQINDFTNETMQEWIYYAISVLKKSLEKRGEGTYRVL